MNYSAAMTTVLHRNAVTHLLRDDGQEDLCFALWYPSQGRDRMTALLHSLVLPNSRERNVHGNVSFSSRYFERALGKALSAGAGLAFLHSHLGPGWQDMSGDDIAAEQGHAGAVLATTGLPFVGLTLGTDGAWSARFWERTAPRTYERQWCDSTRVVGGQLMITPRKGHNRVRSPQRELLRTVSAWGQGNQTRLEQITVGIIGAGSVGAIVAEALARMGVTKIRIMDFDSVEPVNLDRQLHATRRDALLGRSKVGVLSKAIRKSATARDFHIEPFEWSVVEEAGFRAALDCDVLFSCVDRPWPRSVLNFIAYAHLITVIDGGIVAEPTRNLSGLLRADWRAHIVEPGRRCLECLRQYDPGLVAAERDGYLDDPSYIAGLPKDHLGRRNENVFAFSLAAASLEVLQFLYLMVAPLGLSDVGAHMYHFVPGKLDVDTRSCDKGCYFSTLVAKGDRTGLTMTGRHVKAEQARAGRIPLRRST
jgi:molybdopterin-synthase adenylyltransferase